MYNSHTNHISEEENWLESPFPQNHCPYCGEDYDVLFERVFHDDEVIYWATCQKCKRTWGQRYCVAYSFEENCEYDEENDAPMTA